MSARRTSRARGLCAMEAGTPACRFACVLVVTSAGCGGAGLLTSAEDYAAYRATRVSVTLEGRLASAATYVDRFPNGAYAEEVRAYLDRAEPIYYAAKRGSIAGLQTYLQTLPSGAFSKDAAFRLRELTRTRDSGDLSSRSAAEAVSRLSAEQAERRQVREAVSSWVRRFLTGAVWSRPLSEAPAEIVVPFSLSLPSPVCARAEERAAALDGNSAGTLMGARRCTKLIELPYVVKANGESEPREATVEVVVAEDPSGRPLQVTIGGPDLFVRLAEARAARAVASDDAAGRIDGISEAVELARTDFSARISDDPACRREAVAPVVLHLECKSMRLSVRAAVEPGGDDTITLAPVP